MSLLCGFCVFLYLIGNLKGQLFLPVIIKISLNLHTKALSINTCFVYSYYIQYCTVRVFITFSLVFFSYFCSVLTTQYTVLHSTHVYSTQYTVHMSTVSAFCLGSSLSLTVYCMACLFICSPSFCLSVRHFLYMVRCQPLWACIEHLSVRQILYICLLSMICIHLNSSQLK